MVKIYFDESRNTGEIGENRGRLDYFEQRYFVLVGIVDDKSDQIEKYMKFKEKNISKIYKGITVDEIKGTDLLKIDNEEYLNEFIEIFIKGDNILITLYDKKFYLITTLIYWIHSQLIRDVMDEVFIDFTRLLINIDDKILIEYLNVTKNKNKDEIKNFLVMLSEYSYEECLINEVMKSIKKQFIESIKEVLKYDEDEYLELLVSDVMIETKNIRGKERNHIVNLTALSETILLFKANNQLLTNRKMEIFHDNIEVVEEYIQAYHKPILGDNLTFIDSKTSLHIQLADNIASIMGRFYNSILPYKSKKDILDLIGYNKKWIRNNLKKIYSNINLNNVKMVVSIEEQSIIQTITLERFKDYEDFYKKMKKNEDRRITQELFQHIKTHDVEKILKK